MIGQIEHRLHREVQVALGQMVGVRVRDKLRAPDALETLQASEIPEQRIDAPPQNVAIKHGGHRRARARG